MKKGTDRCSILYGAVLCLLIALGVSNCSGGGSTPNNDAPADGSGPGTDGFQPASPVACEDTASAPAGATFYLDPVNGHITNTGSAAR